MANHKSAIKRNRQSIKRNVRNRAKKSEIFTLTKKVLSAPKEEAQEILKALQSKIDKASKTNTLHWKTAARKISKAYKALAAKS